MSFHRLLPAPIAPADEHQQTHSGGPASPLQASPSRRVSRNPLLQMRITVRLVLGFLLPALMASLALAGVGLQSQHLLAQESLFYQELLQSNASLATAKNYLQLIHPKMQEILAVASQPHPPQETIHDDQTSVQGLALFLTTILETYLGRDTLSQHPDVSELFAEAGHGNQVAQQQTLAQSTLLTWRSYHRAIQEVLHAVAAKNSNGARDVSVTLAEPTYTDALSALESLIQFDGLLIPSVPDATSLEVSRLLLTTLLIGLGVLLGIGVLGWLISSTLVRRLQSIRLVVQSVGMGQLDARLPVVGRDELADVSDAVNGMLDIIVNAREVERLHQEMQVQHEALTKANARLEHLSTTDNLTNLGNHRAYQEDLRRTLESGSDHGESLVLAIIDIDGLKLINETSGHLEGDRVLTAFAAILRDGHLFEHTYRLSGDEFAVILPQMTLSVAMKAMQQLCREAEQGLSGATVSIGIADSLLDGDREVLQEQAHLAVSEAKRRSHNTTVTFEDIRESVSLIAPAKVQALHRLLSERRVNVAFQPIWDVEQDRLLAFEALTRPPGDYGFSGPQEAFDIAEKIGRAHELDYVCVHAILARAAELPSDALLFLNLTPQTLAHDVLTGAVLLEAVLSAGLTTERIVLEITERSVVRLDVVVREAQKLRTLGFRLALDDTGAGNAGLEMLSQLAVDFVKIDRAIVVKALSDASARTILTGITAMAQQMNSYVIAEGIEDVEMLNLVQGVGAQAVQGYLVGRPTQVLPSAHELQALRPSAQRASRDRLAAAL